MGAYKEFEKIIFGFTMEAAQLGGQAAVDKAGYGHIFHFEDKDAIKFLEKNAAQLSQKSIEKLRGNLDKTIIAGVREGKPIREITKDVRAIFDDMKGFEAERIARTEVARGTNNGALVGYDSMGVVVVEWYANAGACPDCSAQHGALMTIDEAMNSIPLHPNCYCFWLPRPDITSKKVQGWKSLGEISGDVIKGLGVDLVFSRVSMRPEILDKIAAKSDKHLGSPERARLAVETAEYGFIDRKNYICVLSETEENWNIIPIKRTKGRGLEARTAYEITQENLDKKLKRAEIKYGF